MIADDHYLFMEGITGLLQSVPGYSVIGQSKNTASLLKNLEQETPDLVIQDYRMPGSNSLIVINQIKIKYPSIKLILLTGLHSNSVFKQALASKAHAILVKDISSEDLLNSIKWVMLGKRVLSPCVQEVNSKLEPEITSKEFQILELIFEGFNSNEMAKKLNRSAKTIENHRYNLMQKLGVKNVAGLMRYIHNNGLIES